MKHFINDRSGVVTEALDAVVMLGERKLARLDGFPAIKVVVRADWDRSRVAVVAGGGSGHEPAHAGFVGAGMLTAAVCGELFASPSVDAVLAGIVAVTGVAGCLLIVKNYTGDRLNFGLAAEKARALGLEVEMVVVGDDIAIAGASQPRGLAGTLFVHKVAGHLAASGATLAEVKAGAERVARAVRSLGLSLSTVTLPGLPTEERIGPEEVELGLGIHGEPGAEKIAYRPVAQLAAVMTARLERAIGAQGAPVALLINDLGGVPPIEMAVATCAVLDAMKREVKLVFGPERLMTSLDMKGLSISALALDPEIEEALLSPVGPRAWAPGRRLTDPLLMPLPTLLRGVIAAPVADEDAVAARSRRRVVEAVCATLVGLESQLNALDARVGDGDTGSTFATAARAIAGEMEALPFGDAARLCTAIAERLATVMGGSSGILLSIGVSAMGLTLAAGGSWAGALRAGARRVQEVGGAEAGDRTLLDALLPAVRALEAGEGMAAAAAAARTGAERTAGMAVARAGRSSYVPGEALRGVPDPGAVAFAALFATLAALEVVPSGEAVASVEVATTVETSRVEEATTVETTVVEEAATVETSRVEEATTVETTVEEEAATVETTVVEAAATVEKTVVEAAATVETTVVEAAATVETTVVEAAATVEAEAREEATVAEAAVVETPRVEVAATDE